MLSDDDIEVYLKLYLLLYADDTKLMAEPECELQAALNAAHHYCTLWKLEINTQKIKVMIFSRGKSRNIPKFNYNGLPYLGIDFSYNVKFNKCKKHLFEQVQKAMYSQSGVVVKIMILLKNFI